MATSVFDLFRVGIGPSSSHTVGPLRAARLFILKVAKDGHLHRVETVRCRLQGSLGATGRGHATDRAVVLGLSGEVPEAVSPDRADALWDEVARSGRLALAGGRVIAFDPACDLEFAPDDVPAFHPNGLSLEAFDAQGQSLARRSFFSVGGGFVVDETAATSGFTPQDVDALPHPFANAATLLDHCHRLETSVSGLMMMNEASMRPSIEVRRGLLALWEVMRDCVNRGLGREGTLPGGLSVKRRAPDWHRRLVDGRGQADPLEAMDWVQLWALAVNEENASGGRVVTAPTNGAAGIIPAVLHYYLRFVPGANEEGIVRFFLAAGAVGLLFKRNGSISGAEVGCQGEVGSACSMAAAGLAEVLGGTPAQVENAAEIGMEHNLGLTCDPIAGLVQVPCIERNALAAVKAVAAARMALRGDGTHLVSLDRVIATMMATGRDMSSKYKETAQGGLAVNLTEC